MADGIWRFILFYMFLVISVTALPLDSESNEPLPNLSTASEETEPVEVTSDGLFLVDDMILTREQYLALQQTQSIERMKEKDHAVRIKRKAVYDARYHWKNGIIPYVMTNKIKAKALIEEAMKIWQQYTCIAFRPVTSSDTNFTTITSADGYCRSHVGRSKGHMIELDEKKCYKQGTLLHELGHAIGLYHEHSRPDRDEHIQFIFENANHKDNTNFQKEDMNTYNIPYDCGSIMHYRDKLTYKNTLINIKARDPECQKVMGQNTRLSFSDVKIVNLMYSCGQNCPKMNCPNEGFVGKDCKCWCKGEPVGLCEVSTYKENTGQTQEKKPTWNDIDKQPEANTVQISNDTDCSEY